MRAHFAGNRQPLFLGQADHLHAVRCRTVAQMKPHAGLLRQQDISCHDHILHGVSNSFHSQTSCILIRVHHAAFHHVDILAMGKNRDSTFFGSLHSLSVKGGIHHRLPVFADGMAAFLRHPFNVCQFLSILPFCYRPDLNHICKRVLFCPFMHISDFSSIVNDGLGVGHSTHRRDAASYGSRASGLEGLFIFQARISEVHMQVYEPRHDIAALRIDDLPCRFFYHCCNLLDSVIFNQHIIVSVYPCKRIDDMSIFN